MLRRLFVALVAFACTAAPALCQLPEIGLYELRSYTPEPGRQADVLKLMATDGIKMIEKNKITLIGVWTPLDSKDERVFSLLGYKDKAASDAAAAAMQNDASWKDAVQKTVVDGKKAVKSFEKIFMTANDYSPAINMKSAGNRVFELRTYIASKGNLDNLNARFRNHTLKLFEKHGMTNIAYWSVLDGEKLTAAKLLEAVSPPGQAKGDFDAGLPATGNSLVYFITHASQDAAKESFKKFGGDDEWTKARTASEAAAGGSLTAKDGVKSLFLKPVDFSPLK